MEETITITDAQYYAKDGANISIKATFDGEELSIPLDSDNSDSNDKLIRENLIINKAGSARYLSLIDPLMNPSKLNFPFDISLLGMGLDGHFASLFPELLANKSLFEVDAPHEIYLSKNALGDPSHKRITMNLSMLLNSDRCVLLVSSESKRGVLDRAIGDTRLPVHHLINQNKVKIEFSDIDF